MIQDRRAVLRQEEAEISRPPQIHRQAAAKFSTGGEPQPSGRLKTLSRANGVPLILGNGKLAGVRNTGSFVAKKQSASNRALAYSRLVGVAHKSGEKPPARAGDLNFLAMNLRGGESDWKADTGIEQRIVVRIIVKIAPEDVAVNPQLAPKRLRKSHFIVVGPRGPHRDPQDNIAHRIQLWGTCEQ